MNKIQAVGDLLRQAHASRLRKTTDRPHGRPRDVPSNYLELMGLNEPQKALLQLAVALTTILTGAVAVLSAVSPEYHGLASTIVLAIGLSTIPASLIFVVGPWPGSRRLYGFVLYCDLSIGVGLVLKDDQLFSIGGTALFAGVTMLCVSVTPVQVCALHIGFALGCLALLAGRAALDQADLWVVAAHSLTMILTFTAPCLLLLQVVNLRARARWAQLDPLTGLANRRGLQNALDSLTPRFENDATVVVSIAIIDIDHFKKVNDHYGHQAGDEALVALGRLLRSIAPDCTAIARVGGDEFACLWGGIEDDVARSVGRTVSALNTASVLPGISVSVGVGSLPLTKGENRNVLLQRILDRADTEMYRSKNRRDL